MASALRTGSWMAPQRRVVDATSSCRGIVAVEIYRSPSEAPAEFLKADSQCGVIAIWTKSGL